MPFAPYATEDDLRHYAFQVGAGDEDRLLLILPRASEIIDLACEVPRGYFAVAPTSTVCRTFIGQGTSRLRIAPHVGQVKSVEYAGSDDYAPEFDEHVDRAGTPWLIARDGQCWRNQAVIEVEARWGWEQVPEEIVQATCELVISIWRGRDSAYARVVADVNGGNTIQGALPDRVKLTCDQWKRRNPFVFA
jgi:hypothetical protein